VSDFSSLSLSTSFIFSFFIVNRLFLITFSLLLLFASAENPQEQKNQAKD
jgi:hypothetical protein